MMKITSFWLGRILVAAVLLLVYPAPSTAVSNSEKKRVLVINSYHAGYSWSDSIMQAIRSEFDRADLDASLIFEYMDTKRFKPEELFSHLEKLYAFKYRDPRFDVIISSDNNALNFLLAHRERLFPGVPIVFCGINDYDDSLIEGRRDITGVAEDFDMKGTMDLALRLQPGVKRFVAVSDSTASAARNLDVFRKAANEFKDSVKIVELTNLAVPELIAALKKLPKGSAIFHLDYYLDRSRRALTVEESFKLINENCNLPVYANTDNKIGKGALGGVVTSGRLQGEYAARMAIDILKGKSVRDIPVLIQSPKTPMFDYNLMRRFGISTSKLPAGSIVLNEPESFYYKHKTLIWITATFLSLQLFAVIFLVVTIIQRKRANETLRESEQRYRVLYEEAPHAYFSVDVDGRIKMVNRQAGELLGYSRDDLVGRPVFDLYADSREGKVKARELFKRFRAGGEISGEELEMHRADGSSTWIHLTVRPVRDAKGNIVQSRSMVVDVTGRKKAEEALIEREKMLQLFIEHAPTALAMFDHEMHYLAASRRWMTDYGLGDRDIIGRSHYEIFPEIPERWRPIHRRGMEGEVVRAEEDPFQRQDGTTQWLRWEVRPWYKAGGDIGGIVIFTEDITDRKQAEQELKKHRDHLEDRVQDRTKEIDKKKRELEQANIRLQEMDRLKSVFLSSMSHELRTPLNSIIGFTGILLMGMSGELNDEQKKQLEMAKTSANHLLSLINEILDISKIEAGKVELDPSEFDLKGVVEEVVTSLSPAAGEKRLKLLMDLQETITLFTDKRRLKQVVMNLLSNAVKFTDSGEIRVEAHVTKDEGRSVVCRLRERSERSSVVITVSDTGIGIKQEDLKRLFMPFQQVDMSLTKKHEGTGLGLNLSRKLVELMGGKIGVRSEYGKGSEFVVELPVKIDD